MTWLPFTLVGVVVGESWSMSCMSKGVVSTHRLSMRRGQCIQEHCLVVDEGRVVWCVVTDIESRRIWCIRWVTWLPFTLFGVVVGVCCVVTDLRIRWVTWLPFTLFGVVTFT